MKGDRAKQWWDKYPLNPAGSKPTGEIRKENVPIKGGDMQLKRGIKK